MAILLSKNIAQCDDRARRPCATTVRDDRACGAATARRSVGLRLVEILSWMRHCVRQSVPKATSSGGGPESVTDTLSSVMPTGPSASTAAMKVKDGENSANNGGGGDTQTLSSLQATVKLLSDQMAWFVERLKEPEAELDSVVFDGAPDCAQPEGEEGEIVEALNDLGNAYADIANLGAEVDGQLATIVNNILTSRMTDEKLREKMEKFIRRANCDKLEITWVNPEIWEKLSAQALPDSLSLFVSSFNSSKIEAQFIHLIVIVLICFLSNFIRCHTNSVPPIKLYVTV